MLGGSFVIPGASLVSARTSLIIPNASSISLGASLVPGASFSVLCDDAMHPDLPCISNLLGLMMIRATRQKFNR